MVHSHDHEHGHEGAHAHEHGHNGRFQMSRKTRLRAVIAISFCFFLAEISVGFYTKSLALVADAFHYLNDLIGFIVALVAVHVTESKTSPDSLSFGWARAQLLGAFFNGAFLLALGLSIALQSIERFVSIERVENPKLVLIIGCVGLTLNLISALFLHEHDHDHGGSTSRSDEERNSTPTHASHMHITTPPKAHGMDLGILGVLIHVLGDAINNIGVIISALIIWFVHSPNRFYADPAVSTWIALMILISAVPLTKRSGKILLQSAPLGVKIEDVKHDLESIPGVVSVHELHVWRLDQRKAIASAHVVVSDPSIRAFMDKAKVFTECLHAYGIHSATLQPELVGGRALDDEGKEEGGLSATSTARPSVDKCGVPCGVLCEELKCCN
ncbi:cation efflux protein [Plenodomus tracheiphilus IPT5]|uniref:Cation efflux protein n=1 Tax=Plenodomus tracheiphilus IPT5 TaxID=1408161 RepID=A0A6A7AX72_9PLEO|nr:cation efflux protein [Plenodomus tracheiphilus IPT5]